MSIRNGRRDGFTLVELLTVIVVIAILLGMLFPAVSAIREAARQTQCRRNVQSQTTALYNYYSAKQNFPMGVFGRHIDLAATDPYGDDSSHVFDNRAGQGAAWSAYILPFLDQKTVHQDLI